MNSDSDAPLPRPAPRPGLWRNPRYWPLYVRVLWGVAIGAVLGWVFGTRPIVFGMTNAHLGDLATLIIRLLTAMAAPLIFFAILDAFVATHIGGRQGLKMVGICAVNVVFAFAVGLTILNLWQPGLSWRGHLESFSAHPEQASSVRADRSVANAGGQAESPPKKPDFSLRPLDILKSYVPTSVVRPFVENNVLTVAALAILFGAALRSVRRRQERFQHITVDVLEHFVSAAYQVMLKVLEWIIEIIPLAICGAVADVVGKAGLSVFSLVGIYLITVLAGLSIHALIYYPLSAWIVGGKSPWVYFGRGCDAVLTGFSINSSLATMPITLDCLRRMRVSDASARLSACVGTNFNNDGITLYEAMTALFIAQAAGYNLTLSEQIAVLFAGLAASLGIAGIPASGLIVLPLVLTAAGLPAKIIAITLPLVQSVDVINARVRSAVNVLGDMQVAILLDAGQAVPDEIDG